MPRRGTFVAKGAGVGGVGSDDGGKRRVKSGGAVIEADAVDFGMLGVKVDEGLDDGGDVGHVGISVLAEL